MLNRSAVAISPRQPFLDWLNYVEGGKRLTLDELDKTLYLVPDYEDPEDAEKVLRIVYGEIFRRELAGWYTLEDVWPKDRSYTVFKQWFNVEHFDVIEDLVDAPLEDE